MGTGSYMANQMDDLIERGIQMNDEFEVFGKSDILFGGKGKIKIIEKLNEI